MRASNVRKRDPVAASKPAIATSTSSAAQRSGKSGAAVSATAGGGSVGTTGCVGVGGSGAATSVRAETAVRMRRYARHAPDATVASTSTIPTSRARRPVARAGVVLPLSAVINAGIQPQSRPQRAASCSAGRVKVRT